MFSFCKCFLYESRHRPVNDRTNMECGRLNSKAMNACFRHITSTMECQCSDCIISWCSEARWASIPIKMDETSIYDKSGANWRTQISIPFSWTIFLTLNVSLRHYYEKYTIKLSSPLKGQSFFFSVLNWTIFEWGALETGSTCFVLQSRIGFELQAFGQRYRTWN